MPQSKIIPKKTTRRSLLYIRILNDLIEQGREFVSSQDLAEITGLTDVQIRKDISNIKPVGKPRVGYDIKSLKTLLENNYLSKTANVVIFGVGNLGTAILKYQGFHTDTINVTHAFDKDPKKIGRTIQGIKIYSINEAPKLIPKSKAEIGILATPKEISQETANLMVKCGLKGIMNFSPTTISVPKEVLVKNIDLSIAFLSLFCDIQQKKDA